MKIKDGLVVPDGLDEIDEPELDFEIFVIDDDGEEKTLTIDLSRRTLRSSKETPTERQQTK